MIKTGHTSEERKFTTPVIHITSVQNVQKISAPRSKIMTVYHNCITSNNILNVKTSTLLLDNI